MARRSAALSRVAISRSTLSSAANRSSSAAVPPLCQASCSALGALEQRLELLEPRGLLVVTGRRGGELGSLLVGARGGLRLARGGIVCAHAQLGLEARRERARVAELGAFGRAERVAQPRGLALAAAALGSLLIRLDAGQQQLGAQQLAHPARHCPVCPDSPA
jgi:hypothetical protein